MLVMIPLNYPILSDIVLITRHYPILPDKELAIQGEPMESKILEFKEKVDDYSHPY